MAYQGLAYQGLAYWWLAIQKHIYQIGKSNMVADLKFSANLGFLWTDRPLDAAIHAAYEAGFDAVECHWPYETEIEAVNSALKQTGLKMLGLNTLKGKAGENGLLALASREDEARQVIDQAIAYAVGTDTQNIHTMAGFASGQTAQDCFVNNLSYACDMAARNNKTILIEPLNHFDAPDYFLSTTHHARDIIQQVGKNNLKLMFDCYHVQIMQGDLCRQLEADMDIIGHIQFASVPDRGAPDNGEVNYQYVFDHIKSLGYGQPLGAEYKPAGGDTDASLGWLAQYRPKS